MDKKTSVLRWWSGVIGEAAVNPPSTPGKRGARVASLRCSILHASKIIVRRRRKNASENCVPPVHSGAME